MQNDTDRQTQAPHARDYFTENNLDKRKSCLFNVNGQITKFIKVSYAALNNKVAAALIQGNQK